MVVGFRYSFLWGVVCLIGAVGCTKVHFKDEEVAAFSLPPEVTPPPPPLAEEKLEIEDLVGKVDGQKIDILWVIDNSPSMLTSQQKVADNFGAFIQEFNSQNYDFQMGVTTTDAFKVKFGASSALSLLKKGGVAGDSGYPILSPTTPNLNQNFMTNILQGESGDADERAFQSMMATLDDGRNRSFLRSDAHLAVIIVSDEDDLSHDEEYWTENKYSPYLKDPTLHDPKTYSNQLIRLKGSADKVSLHTIAIKDEDCRKSLGGGQRKVGKRYFELTKILKGTNVSLCSDFSRSLKFLSNYIIRRTSIFRLAKKPKHIEKIEVTMRSALVPRSAKEGWDYSEDNQSVQFFGEWAPQNGEPIRISYPVD